MVLQHLDRLETFFGRDVFGEQRHVGAFCSDTGVVELDRLIRREQSGNRLTQHSYVERTAGFVCHGQEAFDIRRVGDGVDAHVGYAAQRADVVGGLVGYTAGGGEAGNEAHEAYGQIAVCHGHLNLVQNASVQEDAEGMQIGQEAFSGKTGSPADHVLFGDAQGESMISQEVPRSAERTTVSGCFAPHSVMLLEYTLVSMIIIALSSYSMLS